MYSFYFFILLFMKLTPYYGYEAPDCSVSKNYFSKHLATKTPYRFVKNNDESIIRYDGCEAKKIWMLVRHGTRNPSEMLIVKMRTRLPAIRDAVVNNHNQTLGSLCESELVNLTLWTPQIEISDQKRLAHEGEDEMVELAERFQNRFPSILTEDYSNTSFKFRYTATQRTKESQRHFTIGLFGRKVARYVWSPEPVYKDPILRFYKLCTKWAKEVNKNPDTLLEKKKFEQSETMKNVIDSVSRRLGFSANLSLDDIEVMYKTCAYETSWNSLMTSPWCFAFSEEDIKALEYSEDLDYYWVDGYGHSINYEQACPMVGDMLHSLTSDDEPHSTFYFAHSGTMLKVLSHLGLYKDVGPLKHDNYDPKRLWKVSQLDAFATNLAFVLFQCTNGSKVLTLHQERPVILPGCPTDSNLCPLEKLVNHYYSSLYECRFSELCQLDTI